MGSLLNHTQWLRPVHMARKFQNLKPRLFVSGTVQYVRSIYVHTYSACDRASVLDQVRCTATYVMTMVMNMKELASVSCIVKGIKFYSGINSFSSFDDVRFVHENSMLVTLGTRKNHEVLGHLERSVPASIAELMVNPS